MFCSQCGRQIPDGSRFCNYCGKPIAVNDMNPDEKPAEEHYQDYGAFDAPKGFETLPYNKHGYGQQTTNSQQTQVPQGGFVQKDYTQKGHAQQEIPIYQHSMPQWSPAQASAGSSAGGQQNSGTQSGAQQYQVSAPWQQDFATRPVRRKKKWLLPAIIGGAVLLVLAAVLFFCCDSEPHFVEDKEDPALQANLGNWGYACKLGEDYYVAIPGYGIIRAKEENMSKDPSEAPEPELIMASDTADGTVNDYLYLVPAGKWLYFVKNEAMGEKQSYTHHAYDTKEGRDYELFTETGNFCFTLGKVTDYIYYCFDGDIYYIDTTVSPEKGELCKKETGIRLGDDPNVALGPGGFLVAQHGNCRGLKLISWRNDDLRTYEKLKDQELYIHLVWNGYAYYHRQDVDDTRTIYRLNLATGDYEVFASQESMGNPFVLRMNAYDDRILVGGVRESPAGGYEYCVSEFYENGELRFDSIIPDAPRDDISLLCMVNTGKYMITRLFLRPDSPAMHIYTLPDMKLMQ